MDKQEKNKLERELAELNQKVASDPRNIESYFKRGNVYRELGRHQESIHNYEQVTKLDPKYAVDYNSRGAAQANLKNYQDAINDYNQAIKLKPDYAIAYYNRGLAQTKLKNHQVAINDYSQAIKLYLEFAEAYYSRGNVHSELKNYQDAINDYNQTIKLDPNYAVAYYSRGNVHSELKNYQDAINDYSQAIKLKPDYAIAYYNRGVVKDAMGLAEEAKEDFKKANELAPILFYRESSKDDREEVREVKDFQKTLKDLKGIYENDQKRWRCYSISMIIITSSVFFFLPLAAESFFNYLTPHLDISYDLFYTISIKLFFLGLTSFCLAIYRDSRNLSIEAGNRLAMAQLLENIRGNEPLNPEIKNLAYPQLLSAIIYNLNPDKSKGENNKNVTDTLTLEALSSPLRK